MQTRVKIIKNIMLCLSLIVYFYLLFLGKNQYIFNMNYIKCIILSLLICLLLFIWGIVANEDKTYKTNINLYIFIYIILLISVTFIIGRSDIGFYDWWYSGQYEPFYMITSELKYGSKLSILKNVIGNSIMLIPLSFLLMLKNKKYNNIFKQSIIIVPIVITIEILQASTHTGIFDIDDILLNYLGTIIFTFIITRFNIIEKIRKLFYTDYKIPDKIKYLAFYLIVFILIIYVFLLFNKCL